MNVIDLCCGAGGFSEGFRQAGFEIILGVDIWDAALRTFKHNQNAEVLNADIRTLDSLPECDVLIGSPPCQEFSVAKQISRTFDLDVVKAFLNLVDKSKPKYWVMENSPELSKYINQPCQIIKACGYGLKQKRRRAFFGTLPFQDFNNSCIGHEHIPAVAASEWKGCSSKSHMHRLNRYSDLLKRKAGIEECKKEMGYPESYRFFGTKKEQYIQIGNSVCPPVGRAIAEAILREERCLTT